MMGFKQHFDHSFSSKNFSCLFRDGKTTTKLWYQIFESTSSQLMLYLKNSETFIGFFRENIFKFDIWTTLP